MVEGAVKITNKAKPRMSGRKPNTLQMFKDSFESMTHKNGDCLEWTGSIEKLHGYGRIKLQGKSMKAHRASYLVFKGEIPEKMMVCHTCDNRKCVNPEHLFLGTAKDNAVDCVQKKRTYRQSVPYEERTKLHPAQVLFIHLEKLLGRSNCDIARQLGISHVTVRNIAAGKARKRIYSGFWNKIHQMASV